MALLASGVKPCVPIRTNSLGMELALIPEGSYHMGSPPEEPRRMDDEGPRAVTIRPCFYLGVFPVTQREFRAVMGYHHSHFTRRRKRCRGLEVERFPVESVSWTESMQFCQQLTTAENTREEGWEYRLPTETEWEYACRAWLSLRWPFHHGASLRAHQANFNGQYPYPPGKQDPEGTFLERPCPVGLYPPNAFGLYDMHGNVDEWCLDWHVDDLALLEESPTVELVASTDEGGEKAVRGGSWRAQGEDCRAAVRIGEYPDQGMSHVGFRVALVRRPGRASASGERPA
jgi:formylglycine-generating enzyme required for sulfatase activity